MKKNVDANDAGHRIKIARIKKGYTQEQLAEMTGFSTTHISHVETGNVIMSVDCMIRLANCLELSLDEMFCASLSFHPKQPVRDNLKELKKLFTPEAKTEMIEVFTSSKKYLEILVKFTEG